MRASAIYLTWSFTADFATRRTPNVTICCGSANSIRQLAGETIAELAGIIRLQFRRPLMNQACVSVSTMAKPYPPPRERGPVFSIPVNVARRLLTQLKYTSISFYSLIHMNQLYKNQYISYIHKIIIIAPITDPANLVKTFQRNEMLLVISLTRFPTIISRVRNVEIHFAKLRSFDFNNKKSPSISDTIKLRLRSILRNFVVVSVRNAVSDDIYPSPLILVFFSLQTHFN